MAREKRDRAYGPYKHRNKWRVVVVGADGERTTATYTSEAVARQRVAEVNAEAIGRTVGDAIEAFMATSTMKPRSQKCMAMRLRGITGKQTRMLRRLTVQVVREHFVVRAQETSGDTQFHEIASGRTFAEWCIGKGWLAVNPFLGLRPTKARKRGKPQYRIDEAKKLLDVCLAEDSKAGAAVAVAILCGMRASAVTNRSVRDLDDGGRILWIEHDKTAAGNRTLELPYVLRDQLLRLAADRPGTAKLFEGTNRDWLRYHTRRLAKKAKVPVLSPHSLRGTWASIARGGLVIEHVAAALGHASPNITRRNYLSPGLERDLDQQVVSSVLLDSVGKTSVKSFPRETQVRDS